MNKKILFFDVDGTLVDRNHYMQPSTKRALARARELGHITVVNTGRPYLHIEPQIKEQPFAGFVCAVGGHLVYEGQVLHHYGFTHEESCEIRDIGKAFGMDFNFESELGSWCDCKKTNKFARKDADWLEAIGVPVYEDLYLDNFAFDKFVCWPGKDGDKEGFRKALEHKLTFIYRENDMMEVVHKGLSKAKGMEKMMEILGFQKEDSFAIGDGGNDIPMLELAGVGILVGNAPEALKPKADYVTDTIENDGIEKALKHFDII